MKSAAGGSYFSQGDLRLHFGLGKAEKVDSIEIRWPSGHVETLKRTSVNILLTIKEGSGIIRTEKFPVKRG
jgi:enediyne biosynthesis protein E4